MGVAALAATAYLYKRKQETKVANVDKQNLIDADEEFVQV